MSYFSILFWVIQVQILLMYFTVTGEEDYLKDKFGSLAYDINSEDVCDLEKYPGCTQLNKKFTITQNPGEIIFVPSGWHHQVHNMVTELVIYPVWMKQLHDLLGNITLKIWRHCVLFILFQEDTISINHNWINGCNVMLCWSFIKDSLLDVQKQIEDCREMDGWHQQCQVITQDC